MPNSIASETNQISKKKKRKTRHNSSNKPLILTDACAAVALSRMMSLPVGWCHFFVCWNFYKRLERENRMENDIEGIGKFLKLYKFYYIENV